jgi:DNA-directed RNA polymerase subunit alpha
VLIAQRPTLTEITESDTRSQFVIGPLEPGFGYTLGNSIRRTLLSSIPGAAVTRFRVTGAAHEFTSLTGVHEDVTEIILNLKNITVSSEHDEPVVAYLRKKGAGAATAADITAPAGVDIHNPELHIATLSKEGNLEIELTIERGRGYVSVDQNKIAGAPIGTIAIDSIYSPVLRVTYRVEATRAGERTDFDKLVIDVETKASIVPRDAVASAGGTLVELFGLARELNVEAEGIEIGPRYEVEVTGEGLDIRIEELDLTVRSFNCLKREGINTLAQLVNLTEHQLMNIRNFGQKSVDEVLEKLVERGLQLKDGVPGADSAYFYEANED